MFCHCMLYSGVGWLLVCVGSCWLSFWLYGYWISIPSPSYVYYLRELYIRALPLVYCLFIVSCRVPFFFKLADYILIYFMTKGYYYFNIMFSILCVYVYRHISIDLCLVFHLAKCLTLLIHLFTRCYLTCEILRLYLVLLPCG